MAGDLTINNLTCASINNESIAKGFNPILAEYTVTGSAVTSIDFTGLDINLHKSYRIELELINATASLVLFYMFVNGDTTNTNYWSNYSARDHSTTGSSVLGVSINNAQVGSIIASSNSMFTINLSNVNGEPNANFIGKRNATITPSFNVGIMSKIATVANITQLTFKASVASSIGIGSKIRIYRGDV